MAGLITEDIELRGATTVTGNFYPPAGSITNSHLSSSTDDRITAGKVIHQFPLDAELVETSTTIAATTKMMHIVRGATGTLVSLEAFVVTSPTGDQVASVDLQRAASGGSFSTVLSSTLDFDSVSVALTPTSATLSSTELTDGDMLQLVVTIAGSTGVMGAGLLATITMQEKPT